MSQCNILLFLTVVWGTGILPAASDHGDGDSGVPHEDHQGPGQQEKVKFQLFYESECPYSIKIYKEQIKDIVAELLPYLEFNTYPYGNARMKLNGTTMTIECQHEESECYGNMLHACAIDALKDAMKYAPYNSCMMDYTDEALSQDEAAEQCGTELNVDSEAIKKCANGIRGFQLLLHYGVESRKVKYSGVPWWYINGVSKIKGKQKSLKTTLCAAFKNPPEVCKD